MNTSNLYYTQLIIGSAKVLTATMIFAIIVAFWYWRRLNRPLRVFAWFCILTLAIQGLDHLFIWSATHYYTTWEPYLFYWGIDSSNFLSILYVWLNFLVLGRFYYLLFPAKYSLTLLVSIIILAVATLINYLFIEGHNSFSRFNHTTSTLFYIALPALYLSYTYRKLLHFPIHKNPYFWISLGLLTDGIFSFLRFVAGPMLEADHFSFYARLSITCNLFGVLAIFLYCIGFRRASFAKFLPLRGKKLM